MTIFTILLTASALSIFLSGLYFLLFPAAARRLQCRWIKGGVAINLLLFLLGIAGMLAGGVQEVMAAEQAAAGGRDYSLGLGLALIGIGLPTGMATIGAGIAVSSVGSASLAVITEKPEMFGRTLIYLGLAEGIAIYGLVVSILLLGKI
ncbi:MAG TPA: ATP synthase subunit C [Gammaproteobacteria bacterium]|nr:ATP synthase subunit C [Gammaproteobacteria bacterium]